MRGDAIIGKILILILFCSLHITTSPKKFLQLRNLNDQIVNTYTTNTQMNPSIQDL